MARYLCTTGRILSRDSYREEQWDSQKKEYVQTCVYTLRVEYAVNGRIYTHSFPGQDTRGEAGGAFEVLYQEDDPETVMPAGKAKEKRRPWLLPLLIGAGVLLLISAFLFFFRTPAVIHVPKGFLSMEEHLSQAGFQDFTDCCIYRYPTAGEVERDPAYRKMAEADAEAVRGYFEDFMKWPAAEKCFRKKPFDETCISPGDYCIIDTKEGQKTDSLTYGKYDDYSVWFFDSETKTLYFIHNNV